MIITAINDEITKDFSKQINILRKLSVSYIELRKIKGKEIWSLNDIDINEIVEELKSNDIKVSLIDSPIGKHSISNVDNYIKLAKLTSCKYIRIFYNGNLFYLNEIAKQNNIIFLIENERGIYPENLSEINKKIKQYSNINLLLDVENLYSCGQNLNSVLVETFDNIKYIHVRNIRNQKFVSLLNGTIDYLRFFKYLNENKYAGYISAEFHFPLNLDDDNNEQKFIEAMKELKKIHGRK